MVGRGTEKLERTRNRSYSMQRRSTDRILAALAVSAGLVILAGTAGRSQTPAPTAAPKAKKVDPKINEPFRKPNVREYIKKFEAEDRENYARRHEIVAALELKPGMAVADLGAGTGFFTRLFAERVGPSGKVYALEIAPEFLEHIAAGARKRGETQVRTVLASQDSVNLPSESVDLVFLSDVYHHLERPETVLASIRRALRPGGRLVVIDFDRVEGKSSAFVLKHVRAGKEVFQKEIEEAGFTPIRTPNPPRLKENFFLSFRKTATTSPDRPRRTPRAGRSDPARSQ
jgi:ubiquinone/menaquinone biosynthesis C-methylase UbiE